MKAAQRAFVALTAVIAMSALANEYEPSGRRASPPTKPSWDFAITAYPTVVRDGENYTSVIAAADRGPLHLEARYNYESIGARSAFVGWTFSGGEAITWELTPLLGGAWGTTKAFVPGLEVSVAWGKLDFYSEAEYVRSSERTERYLYSWNELGFRPVEWLRIGVAGEVPILRMAGILREDGINTGVIHREHRRHREEMIKIIFLSPLCSWCPLCSL